MDPIRRKILKTGAAATAMAAVPRVFAQQPGSTGTDKFFEKGSVRIYYEEAGAGPPPVGQGVRPRSQDRHRALARHSASA